MIGFAAASISKRTKNSLEIKLRSALKRSKKPVRTKLEVLINVKNLISIIGENAKYLWEKQVSGSSLKNITDFLYEITVFQNVDKMLLMDPSLAGFLTNENVSAIHVNKTIVIFSLSEINLLTGRLVKKENADCIGIECIKVLSENILNLSENGSICDDEILANTFGKYKSWYL
jgi:hypothetical protein